SMTLMARPPRADRSANGRALWGWRGHPASGVAARDGDAAGYGLRCEINELRGHAPGGNSATFLPLRLPAAEHARGAKEDAVTTVMLKPCMWGLALAGLLMATSPV